MSSVKDSSEPSSATASTSGTPDPVNGTTTSAPDDNSAPTTTHDSQGTDAGAGAVDGGTTPDTAGTSPNTNVHPGVETATESKSSSSGVDADSGVAPSNQYNQNQYNPANPAGNTVKLASAPLSPMHPAHMYYYPQGQVPSSPATPSVGNGGYDVQSLLAGHTNSNNMFMRQQYPVIPPLSPAINNGAGGIGMSNGVEGQVQNNLGVGADQQDMNLSIGNAVQIPPASPLFPGAPVPIFGTEPQPVENHNPNMHGHAVGVGMNGRSMVTPNSPSLQYLTGPPPSPVISYGGMYPSTIQHSPDVPISWSDRSLQQQQMYPPNTPTPSPHLQSVQYQQPPSRRTTSFDGEFLPPSAVEQESSGVYATSSGTLFSAQQPWGYNVGTGPPTSPYSQQTQHQPQKQTHPQLRSPPRGRQQGRGAGAGGATQPPPNFYPAATPGPPIQTTHHNKGPEGANLFIFHIPNHFTNLDMWHLFCHYGNLLSVRIMVEKDTGRSRGFGFVSYDSPDAAALAIKELNGFVIGNKRLKVQHKQIRQGEMNLPQNDHVGPPPMYTENNEHSITHANQYAQQLLPPQGDIAAGHQVGQAAYTLVPKEGNTTEHKLVDPSILNMESIGEALPEVPK